MIAAVLQVIGKEVLKPSLHLGAAGAEVVAAEQRLRLVHLVMAERAVDQRRLVGGRIVVGEVGERTLAELLTLIHR